MAKTEVRERIAEAAWRLFDEKGYENVSVDEIIAATGTSKGAFYHYFSAKDELLSALPDKFDNDYDAWAAQCPPVCRAPTASWRSAGSSARTWSSSSAARSSPRSIPPSL